MDFFAAYATDLKAELEGREVPWGGGITMLVARAHNPKYTRILNKLYEAHKHTLDQKETAEQLATAEARSNKIMAETMSKSILLGWTGPVMFKGQPLPYSVANAQMLLEMKDFQAEVAKKAADFKNFRVVTEDADAENLQPTFAGTYSGDLNSTTSSN